MLLHFAANNSLLLLKNTGLFYVLNEFSIKILVLVDLIFCNGVKKSSRDFHDVACPLPKVSSD